jgi:hypothetical protein
MLKFLRHPHRVCLLRTWLLLDPSEDRASVVFWPFRSSTSLRFVVAGNAKHSSVPVNNYPREKAPYIFPLLTCRTGPLEL